MKHNILKLGLKQDYIGVLATITVEISLPQLSSIKSDGISHFNFNDFDRISIYKFIVIVGC